MPIISILKSIKTKQNTKTHMHSNTENKQVQATGKPDEIKGSV